MGKINIEEIGGRLTLRECMFGNRDFYSRVAVIVVPMIIQNTLSNVVSLLDNVMVGQVGTLQMSAVAIVNQLLFIFYVCVWGSLAGAGIYGAQYFGSGDMEGVRDTFRIKIVIGMIISAVAIAILAIGGISLVDLYVAGDTAAVDRNATIMFAEQYLLIMLVGMIPFTLTQAYAGTLRESGRTTLPMIASMTAMAVNFVFNLLLIFGYLGFPKLGVAGAAIATVLSRFIELAIVAIGAHKDYAKYPFMQGVYRKFHIKKAIVAPVLSKAAPLLINEFLWSLGEAVLLQCYSTRGIAVVAAMTICNTIAQIFNEVFLSLGSGAGIVVGQELGAARFKDARRSAWRIIVMSIISCLIMGGLLALSAPFIPRIYNTEAEIRTLACELILVAAIVMPLRGMTHCCYFTMRAGGKTTVTLIFDSCFSWLIVVPTAYCLANFTTLPIIPLFAICAGLELVKCVIGFVLIKSGTWVRNIVSNPA